MAQTGNMVHYVDSLFLVRLRAAAAAAAAGAQSVMSRTASTEKTLKSAEKERKIGTCIRKCDLMQKNC